MAAPTPKRATYKEVLDAPAHVIAEILGGQLQLSPRPSPAHAAVTSALGGELHAPFGRGRGGPGGWWVLDEPELHHAGDVVVPDLAGWRCERLPVMPREPFFTLAPDWVCEALSPSTERIDRADKLPLYAAFGVQHVWLVSPRNRTVEVMRLQAGHWLVLAIYQGDQRVRAEPFEACELELGALWRGLPPFHAAEHGADYQLTL